MRYLSSISLAPAALMALACTAAPNIDATAKELVAEQANNLPPDSDLAVDYYNRAIGYMKGADWKLAIRDFTKAIELGIPTTHSSGRNLLTDTYINRGVSYAHLGQHQTAMADFTKAIRLDPDDAYAYYNRSLIYYELGPLGPWFKEDANADERTACSLDRKYC